MNIGRIEEVSGSVVDAYFEKLPKIKNALKVNVDGTDLIMEVSEHVGNNVVRCIMLGKSDGLYRGQEVIDLEDTISVPVGKCTLGRMFNCLGQPIDDKDDVARDEKRWSIFRDPPKFSEQKPIGEILETGIKVIDLLEPYPKGGKIGLIGNYSIG